MWRRRSTRTRDELAFHRDRLIDDYMSRGMDRKSAERRAFLEFGNAAVIDEASKDVRGRWLEDLGRDAGYALRMLRRNPVFAVVAVLSLALGIGANVAIFSVVNAVLLRPLPVNEPERLVQITRMTPEGRAANVSYPLFEYFRDNLRSVSGAFAQTTMNESIVIDGEEDFVSVDLVSGGYFAVLGLRSAAGRLLEPADDTLRSSLVAVISDRYWQRQFGRSPSAIGRTFTFRDRLFTVVGIIPASFRSARVGTSPDLILPLLPVMTEAQRREPTSNFLKLVARLKPEASVEQANAEAQALWNAFVAPLAERVPESRRAELVGRRAAAFASPDGINPFRDDLAQPLLILMGVVVFILLLACVNLSGLLLARLSARGREVSIRLAIGAGRGRLGRQFLTESLVLVLIGTGLGLVVAGWLSDRLVSMFLDGRDLELSVAPDWRVFGFTSLIAVMAVLVAGLAPALRAVGTSVNSGLKESHPHSQSWLSKALVIVQIAISMVLVVAATLFVGTLVRLHGVDRGFDSDGILVVKARSLRPYAAGRARVVQAALVDRLRLLPGVRSASAAQVLPLGGNDWTRSVQVQGEALRQDESTTAFNVIEPGFFATLGTPVVTGREFDARDTVGSTPVAIVNDAFATFFFGEQAALGRRVTSLNVTYDIVGIVRDAAYEDLRQGVRRTMYISGGQRETDQPSSYTYLLRAAAGSPLRLVPLVEQAVRETDPALRVQTAVTYETIIDRSIPGERLLATLGGLFGLVALVVAGIGMFGVLAFQVTRRTNELGIRIALGATRGAMIGVVLGDVLQMLIPGVAIGIGAAYFAAGLTQRIVFGFAPTDPVVFVIAASVLASAALAAAWLPARRASRVDPLVALRHE